MSNSPQPPLRPPQDRSPTIMVEVGREVIVDLRPEAARRDVSVPRLINDPLDTIVADQLTTAILDDEKAEA